MNPEELSSDIRNFEALGLPTHGNPTSPTFTTPPPMNTEKAKRALQAVLLFHSAGPWDGAKRLEWQNICAEVLGSNNLPGRVIGRSSWDATTRVLCDLVREALEAPKP
jgi:hypothetical protein